MRDIYFLNEIERVLASIIGLSIFFITKNKGEILFLEGLRLYH